MRRPPMFMEPLHTVGGMQISYSYYGNQYEGAQKTKNRTELPYDPAIPLLGKSAYKRDVFTPMFMAVLFPIAKL
jgi:hypothetical protein